jgi:hypothetical protein
MQVGGLRGSSHMAGMSSLWHDPDFIPERRFETPLVTRNYDDIPVPTEQHELPDGVKDPFAKLDAVYDAAALQMERGIKGANFLHGKPATIGLDPGLAGPNDQTRTVERPRQTQHSQPQRDLSAQLHRQDREQHRWVEQAAVQPTRSGTSTTKTAAHKEAEAAANQGLAQDTQSAVDVLAGLVPMAAAQGVSAALQGVVSTAAMPVVQAVQTAGAVTSAAEVSAMGVSEGLSETDATNAAESSGSTPRRGLRRRDS